MAQLLLRRIDARSSAMAGPTRRTVTTGIVLAAGWLAVDRAHAADKVFRIA
jgi:hypothetical protein